jgi:hypothetical protein
MSLLLELIIEFFVQFVGEMLFEIAAQNLKRDKPVVHPVLAVPVYALIGAGLGLMTAVFFPHHLISHPMAKYINLAVTPLLVGLAMGLVGAWRAKKGGTLVRIDKFWYGYAFALAFALSRHFLVSAS